MARNQAGKNCIDGLNISFFEVAKVQRYKGSEVQRFKGLKKNELYNLE
jgi:hypothetical protein